MSNGPEIKTEKNSVRIGFLNGYYVAVQPPLKMSEIKELCVTQIIDDQKDVDLFTGTKEHQCSMMKAGDLLCHATLMAEKVSETLSEIRNVTVKLDYEIRNMAHENSTPFKPY